MVNEEMLDAEIGAAQQEEEVAFAQMAPKGRFSAKALNNLVKATNRLLPKFGQTPDYPMFEGNITEFPTDFVRVLAMFQGATDEAVERGLVDDEFAFDFEDITSDANLMVLAGKINKLASDKQYDRFLKSQPVDESEEGEEMVDDETTTEDMPMEAVDSLFMERM
jgi:hypothetical protein|tara:strand:- start:313 stop:807 length:495 start_codon:yes stop_codon:yes gene_type:complete